MASYRDSFTFTFTDVREIKYEFVEWINVAQVKGQCRLL
jgi:hypothetical protein